MVCRASPARSLPRDLEMRNEPLRRLCQLTRLYRSLPCIALLAYACVHDLIRGCQDAKKDFMRSPDSCEDEQLLGGIEPRLSSTCNVCSLTLMSYVIVKLRTRRFWADLLARWQLQKHGRTAVRWQWPSAVAASAMFICTFPCPPRLPNPGPVSSRAGAGRRPRSIE